MTLLKLYTSPDTAFYCLDNALSKQLALMATPNLFESVVLNHNVVCTHNKGNRPSDQEVSDRLLSN
ncbi:MAG: hypothetical protein KME55_31425 [Nostoc indistinguendum CM1-VF10]|nr:hypothetical protein [Nostoc indistinguendum CM1-VF10]